MLNTHMQTQRRVRSKTSIRLYMIPLFISVVSGNLHETILQLDSVISAEEGDDVTISCFHPKEQINKVLWYKQSTGQKPLLVISSYYHTMPFDFHNDFDKQKHFDLKRTAGSSNLTITKLRPSDSAVYYCAGAFSNTVKFGTGTLLVLKGQDPNKYTVLQHPVPQLLHPEDSVTLQCTVLVKSCSGEHSVYWFRHGSGKSRPGLIYTHRNSSDQCEESSEAGSPTQSCVYKLPKRNLSLSDAGTYYCAVAACGEILFGNGSSLNVEDEGDGESIHVVMICLVVLLFISMTINILLCFTCRKNKSPSRQVKTTDDAVSAVQYHVNDEVNYAALKFTTKSTKVKRVRHHEETIYSGVARQSHMLILHKECTFYLLYSSFRYNLRNLHETILQLDSVISAEEGDDVTLPCFHPKDSYIIKVLWYKQSTGQRPLLVISSYYHTMPLEFHNDFDKQKRFDLKRTAGSSNLTITKLRPSDSAVYYCVGAFPNTVKFGTGTLLVLKGEQNPNKYTVLQHPVPQLLHPEDSVTLQCTVLVKSCSGEHSVYWFRHGSGESRPGIIYTHRNRSDQCDESSEAGSPTQSCIYKLPKKNLSLSDAGTYYCTVAACGEILFGNGSSLKVEDEGDGESIDIVMICLAVL
ncbi:uncharacterized protein [Salminus brasiliensis]|uniref:uncharacterized protein n=1 Tax=Salminus brasiliensis TaxID=930266 RepID=UPI003B831C62